MLEAKAHEQTVFTKMNNPSEDRSDIGVVVKNTGNAFHFLSFVHVHRKLRIVENHSHHIDVFPELCEEGAC
ncbi:hypothetical protein V6N13_087150 [Hibiscus sabdariffa]